MVHQLQLYHNMYVGGPFGQPSTRFGLTNGQVRKDYVVVRAALWYNRNGEYLGWGDLSRHDFWEILHGPDCLERGEFFVVCEQTEVWSPLEEGIPYLCRSCRYIVRWGDLLMVEKQGVSPGTRRTVERVQFEVVSRNDVYGIITAV